MAEHQPTNPFDLTKLMGDFKVPGVDVDALMASQRKNIEALNEANKVAFDGIQTLYKRQVEIIRQAISETAPIAKEMTAAGNPQETLMRQADLAKTAFERAIDNSREFTEIIQKSNTEAFNLLNKRFNEAMEELKVLTKLKKH